MSKTFLARTLIASTLIVLPATTAAQTSPSSDEEKPVAQETQAQADEPSPDDEETAEEQSADQPDQAEEADEPNGEEGQQEVDPLPAQQDETPDQPEGEAEEDEQQEGGSPIEGLADPESEEEGGEGFEPVADIEETELEEVNPADVYPFVEWDGMFRVRSDAFINFDLDTTGTSAILPPVENNLPAHEPARDDADLLWSTNTNLRLDPTIHITENLRVHIEAAILENVVLGSLSDARLTRPGTNPFYRPDPSRTVFEANQISPREREWFENSLQINEAYGEISTFLGSLRAGRMDNDWGLGLHSNGGDCIDCNYGDHVDRIEFMTKPFGIYASAAIDFPDQGITTQTPEQVDDQSYDVSQLDDARQYTFSVFREPRTEKDKQIRQQKLKGDQVPVVDGGARFTMRNQEGLAVPGRITQDPNNDFRLVYRGLDLYVPDVWVEFKYAPDPNTYVRLALEGVGVFGDIDNTTTQPVGPEDDGQDNDVNCFDEDEREGNPGACTGADGESTDSGISQLGAAFESELYFGGPVRFGLNAGYASGGDSPNWGYTTPRGAGEPVGLPDLDFYRFDPNYHVDLILFREVIGSVTNAYYANPYAQARFFESADQRMEVQIDAIASHVADPDGTPAQTGNWLGLELDGAVRYLQVDRFQAEIEGGVLFPFEPLDAKIDNRRLVQPAGVATSEFSEEIESSIAWTVQTNLVWQF